MKTTNEIIEKYLNFSGHRAYLEFLDFLTEVSDTIAGTEFGSRDNACLSYIRHKLNKGLSICINEGGRANFEIVDTLEDIERGYKPLKTTTAKKKAAPKKSKAKPKTAKKKKGSEDNLGKIVDYGKVAPQGKSDVYWRHRTELLFTPDDPKVRKGDKLPSTYDYTDMRYLENFYKMRAFEFGNWLSQQDRINYLSGLGIALFDIHKAIGMPAAKLGLKGRLGVAFGARGYGGTKAHFTAQSFTINLNRYKRPPKVKTRPDNFSRLSLMLVSGGVGSFVHEYGHALDYYAGLHIEKGDTHGLSRDDTTSTTPKKELMKQNTLRGLMERLLYKIIWKNENEYSAYYTRLQKTTQKNYYFQRNEIFARAFEVYVSFKMAKHEYYNVFSSKLKYAKGYYIEFNEMKRLEKDFDTLITQISKHL